MAGINSTATTPEESACIIQAASDYCCNMQAFFDLAEREISEHNNTDFDSMEFLVKAAKDLTFRLSALICETQEKSEAAHA